MLFDTVKDLVRGPVHANELDQDDAQLLLLLGFAEINWRTSEPILILTRAGRNVALEAGVLKQMKMEEQMAHPKG